MFILEDFAQVGLQYFYHEKYVFLENDMLTYFNMIFMVAKAIFFTIEIIIISRNSSKKWSERAQKSRFEDNTLNKFVHQSRLQGFICFLFAIFINAYPISRAVGAFYQAERGDAILRVSNINVKSKYSNL